MERVIVSVELAGASQTYDVELSADVTADELEDLIPRALGWEADQNGDPAGYAIEVSPPGRMLRGGETLAQVQAWDGAHLVFHLRTPPAAPVAESAPQTDRPRLDWPVQGWRPLDSSTSWAAPEPERHATSEWMRRVVDDETR